LAVSRNLTNRDFDATRLEELHEGLIEAEKNVQQHKSSKKKEESELSIAAKDCSRNAAEQIHAVINQVVKHTLFNREFK